MSDDHSTPAAELRRTPLHAAHRRLGARLVPFAGWEMPVQYQGVIDEHRAVRTAAGLFDVSHMGEVRVAGPSALGFLQRLTPNDVAALAPGRAHYSGLMNEGGGYLDDILVYRFAAEEFLLVVNASNAARDFAWIAGQAAGVDGLVVEDHSDRWGLIALQGPRAAAILGPHASVDLGALRYYRFAEGRVFGAPGIVSRTGYTGEDGFEIFVAPEATEAVWEALLEAGSDAGLVPAGLGARDTLRLEAAMALYGHELDESTTPLEAGLDWVVKLDKGDFLGREVLVRQRDAGGPARRLIGFELTGRGIAREGHPLLVDGQAVGKVTSGTFSPTLEKAIGMGYLPSRFAAPGQAIEADVRGRKVPGKVVKLPFYKRGA